MACQIGIVVVENGIITEKLSKLIQPPHNQYDSNTIEVHHITPDLTKDAPTFDVVWEEIKEYLTNKTIVAHNASFDEDVLYKNLNFYGIMPMGIQHFICTCDMYNRTSLHDLCLAFKMPIDKHHDALFDAECCAQFYLNYLNGVKPDCSFCSEKKKKRGIMSDKRLSREVLTQDLSAADPNNPMYDRKVVITGDFVQERREIASILKEMGADVNTALSKKTNFVFIGDNPGPSKMEQLNKLILNGYNIRKLYQADLDAIISGDWEKYYIEKEVKKDLVLTYEHYLKNHIDFTDGSNIIASKELFYGKNFKGNFDVFNQITGNLGAAGDLKIYPETNIIVLSDFTIEQLKNQVKDETIQYIEDTYNKNKSVTFNFKFISESDILDFCKNWCDRYNDDVTLELYEKYLESAIQQIQTKSKYVFKDGKNYCKVNGKSY